MGGAGRAAIGIVRRELLLVTALLGSLIAVFSVRLGLGWGSPALPLYCIFLLTLMTAGAWRLLTPDHKYPHADAAFIIPIVLGINLFSTLLTPDGGWVKPMDYLLVALCALYYPLLFNLSVAGLVFFIEAAGLVLAPGSPSTGELVGLGVFGAYLGGAALVLGRLFQTEHKKSRKAMLAVRRLQEGARNISPESGGGATVASISPEGRIGRLLDSAAELDYALEELMETARMALGGGNALLFMSGGEGDGVYLRVFSGAGRIVPEAFVTSGQGLVGWVVKEKKPLMVNGNARGLGYTKDEDKVESFMAAPMLNEGFLEGVVVVDSPVGDAFDEPGRETLNRFAGLALLLLKNAREYQQADLAAKNFAALHSISSEMSSSLDLATILEKLAELSRDIVPYDYLTVSFMEGEGMASFKVLKGYEGVELKEPVPLGKSLIGWIVENRHQMSFTDMGRGTENLPVFSVPELQTDCRSFYGAPFINQDKVLGVFTVAVRAKDAISAYQQHMLSIIANQVAVNVANARLHHTIKLMATTDGLTGLINHRSFQEKADEKFTRAARFPEPISILLFDIDHFKKVNDTYGHPVGDAVLKRVSKVLKDTVRTVDTAARYGGEEFVALLENTDEAGSMKMAERIRSAIEKTKFLYEGKAIPVTISVGSASFPADATDKKALIEKADQALYWAKGHGRNQCCPYSRAKAESPSKTS